MIIFWKGMIVWLMVISGMYNMVVEREVDVVEISELRDTKDKSLEEICWYDCL